MAQITLTKYQLDCLRRAFREGRFLMLPHEPALRKLTDAGFVTAYHTMGIVWIMPTSAGFTYLCLHPSHGKLEGVAQ
jgi:hypothetical protein